VKAEVATAPATTLKAFRQEMKDPRRDTSDEASSRWVDGRRPVAEHYEDDELDANGGKLSKSDRKRLRKHKAQNRAA
jgi:hypothetical protein